MTNVKPSPRQLVLGSAELAGVCALLQRYVPGVEVRAFGSRARGSAKHASDLDLLVMCDEPLSPRAHALLADAFAESDLPFKVDVIDASTVAPAFLQQILEPSIVIQVGSRDPRAAAAPGQRRP